MALSISLDARCSSEQRFEFLYSRYVNVDHFFLLIMIISCSLEIAQNRTSFKNQFTVPTCDLIWFTEA